MAEKGEKKSSGYVAFVCFRSPHANLREAAAHGLAAKAAAKLLLLLGKALLRGRRRRRAKQRHDVVLGRLGWLQGERGEGNDNDECE